MWKCYALLSAFCAALTAIFSKIGVKDMDPDLATAIRVTFILLLVWSIVFCNGGSRNLGAIGTRQLGFLFLSAIATGCSWLFYFRALHSGDVAKVAPIDKLSVPITILLAFIFLGEPLGWKLIAGGSLITIGAILIIL